MVNANVSLLAFFEVGQNSVTLPCDFYVRHPFPMWTNRRMVNSVIDLDERSVDDGKLQLVTEGVMDDIKTFLLANGIGEETYGLWTDIVSAPLIIRRATAYGVVSGLYSRRTQSFRSRIISNVGPVNVTVKGDEQIAMEHWKGEYDTQLQRYLDATNEPNLVVSTQDEDPIFSMDDIVPSAVTGRSWHEWYLRNTSGLG